MTQHLMNSPAAPLVPTFAASDEGLGELERFLRTVGGFHLDVQIEAPSRGGIKNNGMAVFSAFNALFFVSAPT